MSYQCFILSPISANPARYEENQISEDPSKNLSNDFLEVKIEELRETPSSPNPFPLPPTQGCIEILGDDSHSTNQSMKTYAGVMLMSIP